MLKKPAFALSLAVCVASAAPATAAVVVTFDAPTLDKLLSAIVQRELDVPIAANNTIRVKLEELEVLGFEPKTGFAEGARATAEWYRSRGLLGS